jgi:hypothetical protein
MKRLLIFLFIIFISSTGYAIELDENSDDAMDTQYGGLGASYAEKVWAVGNIPYCSEASTTAGAGQFSSLPASYTLGTDTLEFTGTVVSFLNGLTTGASSEPQFSFQDSDCPGSDKIVGIIKISYIDGVDGLENADVIVTTTQEGAENTEVLRFDESDDQWETTKGISAGAGTFTGNLQGNVRVIDDTNGDTIDATECRGSIYMTTNVADYDLPAAATGLNCCFYTIDTSVIEIAPVAAGDDQIIFTTGATIGVNNELAAPGIAGSFVCLLAVSATDWVMMGSRGTWVDAGATD